MEKWTKDLHGESSPAVINQFSLKWLMSSQDPWDRMARWLVETQSYSFIREHKDRRELVVPSSLSSDAISTPLWQCYAEISRASLQQSLEYAKNQWHLSARVRTFNSVARLIELHNEQCSEYEMNIKGSTESLNCTQIYGKEMVSDDARALRYLDQDEL